MRFTSGLGLAGVSVCFMVAPWTTVSAKTRVAPVSASLRPEFRSMIFMPQTQAPVMPKKVSVSLPDGVGKDVVEKHCSTCHGPEMFVRRRLDKDHWNQIIDNMTSKGMEATDADLDTMLTYLSTNLGPDSPAAAPVAPKPATPNQ